MTHDDDDENLLSFVRGVRRGSVQLLVANYILNAAVVGVYARTQIRLAHVQRASRGADRCTV